MNAASLDADRFPRSWRLLLTSFGLLLVGLLVTALMLRPDSRGYGTHQQLGLPPCTVQVLFQVRCPACGMTTSWAHMVRGRVWSAFRANAGGAMLALTALAVGPWFFVSGVRGRWIIDPPGEGWVVGYAVGLVTVILADWVARQYLFP